MINRVVLVGRVTKDIELRKTQAGISVAQFTVACDRRKSGNEQEQTADFINCVVFRQPAEFLGQYAKKGQLIGLDGRLQVRSYERDGRKNYVTEVIGETVRILEPKNSRQNGSFRKSDYKNEEAKSWVEDDGISSEDLPF